MKRIALFTVMAVASVSTVSAHAVMRPTLAADSLSPVIFRPNAIGGGGGTDPGGGIDPACDNSPENATILLALLGLTGILGGRMLARNRSQRPALAAEIA